MYFKGDLAYCIFYINLLTCSNLMILTVFFLRTAPASKKAKPHCIKKTMVPKITLKKSSVFICRITKFLCSSSKDMFEFLWSCSIIEWISWSCPITLIFLLFTKSAFFSQLISVHFIDKTVIIQFYVLFLMHEIYFLGSMISIFFCKRADVYSMHYIYLSHRFGNLISYSIL